MRTIFSGTLPSGIYRLDGSFELPNLETMANENGFALFVFGGRRIASKTDFLDLFEEQLQPPDYGKNWDSFAEMLEVTDWIKSQGLIILYQDFQNFLIHNQADFEKTLEILQHVTDFHNRRANHRQVTPLFILLQDENSLELPLVWLYGS